MDPRIDSSSKVAVIGGLPLSGTVTWLIDNLWLKPKGLSVDPSVAVVVGGLGAIILGELFKDISTIYRILIDKLVEKLK